MIISGAANMSKNIKKLKLSISPIKLQKLKKSSSKSIVVMVGLSTRSSSSSKGLSNSSESVVSDTTVMEVVVLACCALHTVKGNASVRKKRSSTVAFFIDDYLLGLAKLRLILESWKWRSFFNPNRLFLHSAALFM